MGDNKQIRIKTYYSELNKFIDGQNFSKIIKTSNKILSESENDVKAWQCKVTALIQLGQFQEALQTLTRCKVISSLLFHKAYCEYRLNNTKVAWETIAECPDSLAVKELKAQILYRLERYNDCYSVYRDLIKNTSDQYDQERLTNFAAVAVNLTQEGSQDKGFDPESDASYEQVYNKGCELLAKNLKDKGLKCLQQAETLCRKMLQAEGASEEEINEEVAIIRVQQGYCLQMMKKEREALTIYNDVLKTKPEDAALLAITNNNIVAINREANVFDSKKRFKTTLAPGLEHKLTSFQHSCIMLNHCLLTFYTNQEDLCESETDRLRELYPRHAMAGTIIKASLRARNSKVEEGALLLKKYASSNPENALVAYLCATQILLSQGCIEQAIEMLLSLDESDRYRNGIISALTVLCSSLGKTKIASKVMKDAVEWHKKKETSDAKVATLWRHAANFHLRNGDVEVATASLEELRRLNSSDVTTLAQLISAYCQLDTAKAQELSKSLPDGLALVKNLDPDILESSFAQKYAKKAIVKSPGEPSPVTPGKVLSSPGETNKKIAKAEKKKKRKKVHLPKNYVEGAQLDPERWLPRWQRQGYKPKRKDRRNKDVGKGTQGVSSDVADKFDITKTAGQHRTTHSVPQSDAASGPRRGHQKKKGGNKKKK